MIKQSVIIFFIIFTASGQLYSQVEHPFAIAPGFLNMLYIGVDNPIDIAVFGINPEDITVKISKGYIKENGRGTYLVNVKEEGIREISIYRNGEYIGGRNFSVKKLPDPYACIRYNNCIRQGKIKKSVLQELYGINTKIDLNIDIRFNITSFTLTASIRGEEISEHSNSSKFTLKQRVLIRKAMVNTKIIIDDIKCVGPDSIIRTLDPIILSLQK